MVGHKLREGFWPGLRCAAKRDIAAAIGPNHPITGVEANPPALGTGFAQHAAQPMKERPMGALKEKKSTLHLTTRSVT